MSAPRRVSCLLFSTVALASLAGCGTLQLNDSLAWMSGRDDAPRVPRRIVAVWTDTVMHHGVPGRTARRGFGGRLMFYGDRGDDSVKVDGTLVIYAFDENGRLPSDVKPDKKYVFTAEQLPKYYSKSDLGHSYSVWLPWGELGGQQKEISLIVRFLPKGGPVVIGHPPGIPGLAGFRQEGCQLTAVVVSACEALGPLVRAVDAAGGKIEHIDVRQASLTDVLVAVGGENAT